MDPMLLRIFQQQIMVQFQFLLLASNDLNAGLVLENTTLTFCAVQNILNAAANASKVLWGNRGRLAAQRKEIRDSFGVTDDSPLFMMTMRNHFEHFDSRVDEWWRDSKDHQFFDLNFGNRSSLAGVDSNGLFRMYDPLTADVAFWGDNFNIRSLVNEVRLLLPKLAREAAKPF